MKIKIAYIVFLFSLLLYNCNTSSKENNNSKNAEHKPSQQVLADGFQLTESSCFSCHSPNAALESRIAPSMKAIKKHYLTSKTSYEQFNKDLASFLNNPNEGNSKMPDAIKNFGLMPKMIFSDKQISDMASYIYFSELEKPGWFEKQYQEDKGKFKQNLDSNLSPLELGKSFAMKTKAVLGKNLLGAINTKGTEYAVSFCSTKAIALTDSVAMSLNTKIKRVSDKNRNPNNKANKAELEYIEETKLLIAQGETPKPKLTELVNKHLGYYPIMTNKMCLQCHGQSETEVMPSTLSKLQSLYPNDQAVGYKTEELRGIWVVEMDKI
jgi:cytochrome c553